MAALNANHSRAEEELNIGNFYTAPQAQFLSHPPTSHPKVDDRIAYSHLANAPTTSYGKFLMSSTMPSVTDRNQSL